MPPPIPQWSVHFRQTTTIGLPATSLLPFPLTSTFTPLCLAQRQAAFFTVRHEKALLFYLTQDALILYLFAKAFEQLLL
jgi:hypothetical protein